MMDSNNKSLNRWTQYVFKNGVTTQNRVVIPPMASGTADSQGTVTSNTLTHYQNLTRAGAGIVFVEYTYVHKSGRSEPNQLGIDSDSQIPGHKELASVIKNSGALAGMQLVHGGGKSSRSLTGGQLLGASLVVVPTKGSALEIPTEMTLKEIEPYQDWYLDAAIRAAKSGYDVIELHSAHGYGLNQWLSPLTNQRTDEYGGDLLNRSKMLLEIFRKIRTALPHKVLGIRVPGKDHFHGGLTQAEMLLVSQKLEDLGADFIDVSSGIGGWRRPEGRNGEGYLVEDASQVKLATSLPVIGVGGIENGNTIDQMLREERLDFAAVGRAILKDPEAWKKSHLYAENLGSAI